ncbi:hypothetical protein KC19_5G154500 [Ceratodon purpureus]|uniref:Uncharacterized protein n=1 Tax=Ceratodon purpureus TaxID=3225 RepID=A0A8T0I3P5_CERPU|nr:hypothetical protein KC19_5G154500 [Ceratodon purpureus]
MPCLESYVFRFIAMASSWNEFVLLVQTETICCGCFAMEVQEELWLLNFILLRFLEINKLSVTELRNVFSIFRVFNGFRNRYVGPTFGQVMLEIEVRDLINCTENLIAPLLG